MHGFIPFPPISLEDSSPRYAPPHSLIIIYEWSLVLSTSSEWGGRGGRGCRGLVYEILRVVHQVDSLGRTGERGIEPASHIAI